MLLWFSSALTILFDPRRKLDVKLPELFDMSQSFAPILEVIIFQVLMMVSDVEVLIINKKICSLFLVNVLMQKL